MATKKFTQFSTAAPLTTGDYIVGYREDGSEELKTTVKQIVDLVQDSDNQTLNYNNGNLSISSGNSVTLSSFNAVNAQTQLLSAGTDLFDIFLTSETDSQTLSFDETNKDLSISSGNTISLSSFATNTLLQGTSALLTPLTTTNTLTGQLVLNTDFSNYQTSVAASTATLVKTTDFDSYKTNVASATATLLPLAGGTLTGNLTVNGTVSASSTIFSADKQVVTTNTTTVPGTSAVTSILAVSALPVVQEAGVLYILI